MFIVPFIAAYGLFMVGILGFFKGCK